MKQEIRILGIDDSPFKFRDVTVMIIGVVMRAKGYLEGVLKSEVEVDGRDANEKLSEMINSSRFKEQIKYVMLDGVALGGFNVVDIDKLNSDTKLPIITVTRDKPNFENIRDALQSHFDDWEERWEIIKRGELLKIETEHKPIYVKFSGVEEKEVKEIIKKSTVRGVIPEPIRVAHLIATGVSNNESYGRA